VVAKARQAVIDRLIEIERTCCSAVVPSGKARSTLPIESNNLLCAMRRPGSRKKERNEERKKGMNE
jgi:hypothetical protein